MQINGYGVQRAFNYDTLTTPFHNHVHITRYLNFTYPSHLMWLKFVDKDQLYIVNGMIYFYYFFNMWYMYKGVNKMSYPPVLCDYHFQYLNDTDIFFLWHTQKENIIRFNYKTLFFLFYINQFLNGGLLNRSLSLMLSIFSMSG